ncbi:MAG: SpoIIE family protein phosphatase [Bryobacterales bacterium]|nr:SpoIIE family protein phosphatase [Bryobacterales bacterium]
MHELLITHGDGSTRVVKLEDRPVTVGRCPTCELSFPQDPELSRKHMQFAYDGSHWTVRDLGSTNGTRINGTPLQRAHTLRPGDCVAASQMTLQFRERETASQTVMFEASRMDVKAPGTVAIQLKDVLESSAQPSTSPEIAKQWVSPLQALIRVGRELAVRRPLEEMFPVILDLALEAVSAERGVLLVLEGERLVEKASRGGEFRISTAVRDQVMNDRQSLMIQSVAEAPGFKERKSIVIQGVRSLMAVPLQTDERVIGLLYVDALNYLRRFKNDDLNLLTVMANVAAIRIERERLALVEEAERRHMAELDQAAEIQRRHLPAAAPKWDGLELVGLHNPCRTVGGDYHDYLKLSGGTYGIVVADVAGKGMPAALMMMGLQARVQALFETCGTIADFMRVLNRSMNPTCAPNRFVTVFASVFDPATGAFRYVNAAHTPGLLVRASGAVEQLQTGGMFVGLLPNLSYEEGSTILQDGDLVVLYSDGISEQENTAGEEFGVAQLAEFVRLRRALPLDEILSTLHAALEAWTGTGPVTDDQTLVILRRRTLGTTRLAPRKEKQGPPCPGSAPAAL